MNDTLSLFGLGDPTDPVRGPECPACGGPPWRGGRCRRCTLAGIEAPSLLTDATPEIAAVDPLTLAAVGMLTEHPEDEPDDTNTGPDPCEDPECGAAPHAAHPEEGRTCPGCHAHYGPRAGYTHDDARTYCYASACTEQENAQHDPADELARIITTTRNPEWAAILTDALAQPADPEHLAALVAHHYAAPLNHEHDEPPTPEPQIVAPIWWRLYVTHPATPKASARVECIARGSQPPDPNRGDPLGAVNDEHVRPLAQAEADRLGLAVEYLTTYRGSRHSGYLQPRTPLTLTD